MSRKQSDCSELTLGSRTMRHPVCCRQDAISSQKVSCSADGPSLATRKHRKVEQWEARSGLKVLLC